MGVIDNNEFGTPIAGYPLYAQILDLLGSTGLIIPIGDTAQENAARTTVTTVGAEELVFTYSEAISSFDTPPAIVGPGRIPDVTLNGTDEEADSPDADYWSAGADGTAPNEPSFSLGLWLNMTDATSNDVFNKGPAVAREWILFFDGTDNLTLRIWDHSAGADVYISTRSEGFTESTWTFVVFTYDGSAADSGINYYKDGTLTTSVDLTNGAYTALENLTAVVGLGRAGFVGFFDGLMAGGPLGPFFTQTELTSANVASLFAVGRDALGV